ncbi:hypothetical protein LSTR_LSTR015083 [Laodelphax striatellus]|uniref:Uncharacterized protein n=1 Tax=Laodelphax striatellus TaxID=195883 RepID=A0A482X4E8_LAOST|nr:hypothetical protein LSTR_LSTR015083 [Laodelphax striatellus]
MQTTEGGRKLNQAMVSTGRAVATTGRAVGGAISQAKGALSSWWSNLTTAQSPTEAGPQENGLQSADQDDKDTSRSADKDTSRSNSMTSSGIMQV